MSIIPKRVALRSGTDTLATSLSSPSTSTAAAATSSRLILGMRVDGTSYPKAIRLILAWAQNGESRTVFEVPVYSVMESYDHPDFRRIINGADLITPGGMPIVWMLRLLGLRGQPRVYGPELMLRLCEAASRAHIPVGLYGGTTEVLAKLQNRLCHRYPLLQIVYGCSPPFRNLTPEEEAEVVGAIRRSGCRVLFVGLGCPKQERWIEKHRGLIPVVMLGVGAAFEDLH